MTHALEKIEQDQAEMGGEAFFLLAMQKIVFLHALLNFFSRLISQIFSRRWRPICPVKKK